MAERPVDPDLEDVLSAREEAARLDLDVAIPARVQRYDATTQTADLVPLLRRPVPRPDGGYAFEADPVVPSVPVQWLRVGAWALTMRLEPGDTGLLLCCDGDLGTWRAGSGDVVDPVNLQRHHLSHAVFLPGLYTRGRALARAATGTAAVVLGSDSDGARVTLRTDGSMEIAQGSTVVARVESNGTVHLGAATGAAFVALASLVESRLAAIQTWANAHTHTAAGSPTTSPITPLGGSNAVAASKVKAT